MVPGEFNVIGGGKIIGKHNKNNRYGDEITLTRVGGTNINYINENYYLTDNGFSLKSVKHDMLTKYIYYLLLNNNSYLIELYNRCSTESHIETKFKKYTKSLIPSLERQEEISEIL